MQNKLTVQKWWWLPVICWLMVACDQGNSTSPKNNKVTVNPPSSKVLENWVALGLDKSPMDMSYYPPDYSKLKMSKNISGLPVARVIYSRPQKDGRVIFGSLVKYGTRWRLGANEATEIEFFRDVKIDGRPIKKGRYILYCIPYPDKWTMILNNDLFTWGLKIDSTKDQQQFDIPVTKTSVPNEVFSMNFKETGANAMQLVMAWDSVKTALPIQY